MTWWVRLAARHGPKLDCSTRLLIMRPRAHMQVVVEKPVEVIREVEKPVEVVREVEKIVFRDRPVEKVVEVEKIVYQTPPWMTNMCLEMER